MAHGWVTQLLRKWDLARTFPPVCAPWPSSQVRGAPFAPDMVVPPTPTHWKFWKNSLLGAWSFVARKQARELGDCRVEEVSTLMHNSAAQTMLVMKKDRSFHAPHRSARVFSNGDGRRVVSFSSDLRVFLFRPAIRAARRVFHAGGSRRTFDRQTIVFLLSRAPSAPIKGSGCGHFGSCVASLTAHGGRSAQQYV